MKPLLDALRPWLDRWKALPMARRMMLIAALTLLVGGGVYGWAQATKVQYAVLFGGLEADDAAAIIEQLKAQKIPYKLEGGGAEVWVPEVNVYETRLQLASKGLPDGGGAGFELFDQQKFGESEFSEQVKYHRALEGELTRTIMHVAGVESARVHLVLPSRSVFVNSDNSASASIALRLRPRARLSRDQVKGLIHLVASSVRGLAPENVTIIDGSGRRLSGLEEENEVATNGIEFQRKVELAHEQSLQQILDATLGPGRGVVRVAADVSFSREEVTEERVDPNAVASRSFQVTEERENSGTANASGVPGAVGTLEGADQNLTTSTQNGVTKRSETRNFEISKTVRHAIEPVGRVKGLSVAVVVDGTWTGKGEKRTFVARSPAELATIKNVIAAAAGVREDRGDRITVECVPFADQMAAEPEVKPAEFDALVRKNWPYVVSGAALLLVLTVGIAVAGAMRKRKKERKLEVKLGAETPPTLAGIGAPGMLGAGLPGQLGEGVPIAGALPAPAGSEAIAAAAAGAYAAEAGRTQSPAEAQAEAERIRQLTAEIASADPYLAARIVRGWLSENSNSEEAA